MTSEPVDGVDIPWEDARRANLANWEDRVPLHIEAYQTAALREDPDHLSPVVRTDLEALLPHLPGQSLRGLDLCHLQCHIGTDTVSLARAGARVTGIDFSPAALDAAAALAADCGVTADWIQTDVLDAREAVDRHLGADRQFDVVYTSIGTIGWLNDLDRWAEQVAALVKPGGVFYIRDGHPMLGCLDELAPNLTLRYRYFGDGRALQWDEDGTYVGDGKVSHTRTYEWPHPISEVVTVLLRHGLAIVALDEGKTLPWQFSPRMRPVDGRPDADFEWPETERDLVPCTFTVVAWRL
ncbi:class I SAM-dependent methyltransferase [Demequina sp.]|uniref:class I SAM-dependent methyltransferase n=1 Tax=Demequina sp. TaxID=2050685 RepID=UPI0025C0850F|nr:class I SAM-dependent methyltransferase [Demequina sp.]